ncbi:hypothetical protein BH80429_12780 [Bartonella henselae]|nr:hypothetical protein BH80429_12780 [Bartonella henselae]
MLFVSRMQFMEESVWSVGVGAWCVEADAWCVEEAVRSEKEDAFFVFICKLVGFLVFVCEWLELSSFVGVAGRLWVLLFVSRMQFMEESVWSVGVGAWCVEADAWCVEEAVRSEKEDAFFVFICKLVGFLVFVCEWLELSSFAGVAGRLWVLLFVSRMQFMEESVWSVGVGAWSVEADAWCVEEAVRSEKEDAFFVFICKLVGFLVFVCEWLELSSFAGVAGRLWVLLFVSGVQFMG